MFIDLSILSLKNDIEVIVRVLAKVAIELSHVISLGQITNDLCLEIGQNAGGDGQKALDILADDKFIYALKDTSVQYYASEEKDEVLTLNSNGKYAIAIDPLDGSSNINANISIGTIFSILQAMGDSSFTRVGTAQIVAGYFVYGPQTALVITSGNGTHQFILDRTTGKFHYIGAMQIDSQTNEFAINASNHRHWPAEIMSYVQDCLAGKNGPRGVNYNMRWVASLVAETHRILSRGGVFLYPSDARKGYENGRLRMLYECAPIAFLIEQAGGRATNAFDDILAQKSSKLHARTPFVFGSKSEVDCIEKYHKFPKSNPSPLFNERNLFSA